MKSIIFRMRSWLRGTDPAGRAKHSLRSFISAPIPATPYSKTLVASFFGQITLQMKKNLWIVLILVNCSAFSQNEKVEYDKVVPDFVLSLWTGDKQDYQARLSSTNNPLLDQIKDFLSELNKADNDITSDIFLKKPSDNTLVAYYLHIKLQWNSFNTGKERLKNKTVIENSLDKLPNRYELLAFYYKAIFIDVLNKQKPIKMSSRNIMLDSIDLHNDTEKAIVFLCAMRHIGNQVTSYSTTRFPENCFRAKLYVENMPTFNNKAFYDFKLPEFEDFKIEIDKRYPKASFKEKFIPEFENAKQSYQECLDQDKK
jgi:hypothetical protein